MLQSPSCLASEMTLREEYHQYLANVLCAAITTAADDLGFDVHGAKGCVHPAQTTLPVLRAEKAQKVLESDHIA